MKNLEIRKLVSTSIIPKKHLILLGMDSVSASYFFSSCSKLSQFEKVAKIQGNGIWQYLALIDILNVSVVSRGSAGLTISTESIQRFLENDNRVGSLGKYKISFASDVTLGILRRMLNRVVHGSEGVLSIDSYSGRIILDIGSAFKDRDTYMASMVTPIAYSEDEEGLPYCYGDEPILKAIEHASFDEYDDFNPRHPQMKTHRRGGSYFNSDVGDLGDQALREIQDYDMVNLSNMAINSLEIGSEIPFSERAMKLQKLREQVSDTRIPEEGAAEGTQ